MDDYRSVCNAATLQSDKRGFFKSFAESVEESGGPTWLKKFSKLKSDEERILLCLNDEQVCDIVHGTLSKVQKIFRGKASSFAKSKMEEADHWLKKDKYDRALISANLAVVRAPTCSKGQSLSNEDASILPLSLFIRSEVLFKLSEFQLCLNDLQLALKHHLSSKHKAAAYFRMGMCYLKLGNKNKSKVSFSVADSCGDEEIKVECKKVLEEVETFTEVVPVINSCPLTLTECADGFTGVSKLVSLFSDDGCGRYFKAVAPVSIGDIIACEDPYVSALLFDKHGSHCLQCYKRLKSPIPCPECSGVAFCSIECLNDGIKYHKWECPYLELAVGSGMSILSVLSLRIITQQTLDYFKNSSKAKTYDRVLNLIGHSDKRDVKDLLHRTLMALFLLQLLRHSGYFNNKVNKVINDNALSSDERIVLKEDELKIGTLLLKHLQVLQYNAHEIYETVIPRNDINTQGVTCYVALGVYLSSSMFNHECQPSLARYFSGKKIILRAQRPIEVNQLVSENYGPIFTMKTRYERLKMLKGRYLFDCNCIACQRDWPKLEDMISETAYYRCKNKSCSGMLEDGVCDSCGSCFSIEDAKLLFYSYQEDWGRAIHLITDGKFKEAEKVIVQYTENMCKLVSQPSKNLCLAMEALRTIWANTKGNVSVLPVSIKHS